MAEVGGLDDGLVDGRLERRGGAAAVAAVGGDDDLGLAVLEPRGEGVGGEAAEDDRVRCADARAGQHRHDGLGDHRHVDRDPVAGGDAEVGQRVGGLADEVLQLGVGDRALVLGGVVDRLADEVEGDLVAASGLDVAVDAVVGGVELAADEPLRERRVVPVQDAVPAGVPREALGLLGPEALAVGGGAFVGLLGEVGVGGQVGRRLEAPVLLQQVRQGLVAGGAGVAHVARLP